MMRPQLQRENLCLLKLLKWQLEYLRKKSDEIVPSLLLFMPFISSAARKGDSWAKSSVFSKQSVIDELILCGFASERVREKDYFPQAKTQ